MSQWRRKAIEIVPTLKAKVDEANSPMALWIELWRQLEIAYEKNPVGGEHIEQIYAYAEWCLHEAKNDDILTAVVVGFYEDVLTHKKVRRDLPNRMSQDDFLALARHLAYHLSEAEFETYKMEFLNAKKRLSQKHRAKN